MYLNFEERRMSSACPGCLLSQHFKSGPELPDMTPTTPPQRGCSFLLYSRGPKNLNAQLIKTRPNTDCPTLYPKHGFHGNTQLLHIHHRRRRLSYKVCQDIQVLQRRSRASFLLTAQGKSRYGSY